MIAEALMKLRPGTEFTVRGAKGQEVIEWHTPGVVPPTREEIDAEVANLEARAVVLRELVALDRLTLSGVRGLREFIIAQAQIIDEHIARGNLPPTAKVSDNVGVQKIAQLEQQAAALRAKLG